MNPFLLENVKAVSTARQASGFYRKRVGGVDASKMLNFSSNDYLSLTEDSRLKQAYQTGYQKYPIGSGGSPVVSGYHTIHRELEGAFSSALCVDDALYFSSGYAANLSLAALFSQLDVNLYIDKAIHASMYDGLSLSGARFKRYQHCDVADLERKLSCDKPAVIMTESIFSMSGQLSPLEALANMGINHHIDLCVDEAHAFGVMGEGGLGLVNALGLTQHNVPLRMIPFGKAFAGAGAIVAGQKDWIDALIQSARPYIYSTAPSPACAYGLLHTLDVVRSADDRRSKLFSLIAYFREKTQQSRFTWRDSTTAIQQLQLGCPFQAQALSEKLSEKGIYCLPMRQPTVTKKETGLRVILNYRHTPENVDNLFNCLDL